MISWVVSTSGRPNIFIISPVLYGIGFATLVVLISGPFVSISHAMCCETARVISTIFFIPSAGAWAVFIRTTFIPAKNNLRRKSISHLKSLIEQTIFVCFIFCVVYLVRYYRKKNI